MPFSNPELRAIARDVLHHYVGQHQDKADILQRAFWDAHADDLIGVPEVDWLAMAGRW